MHFVTSVILFLPSLTALFFWNLTPNVFATPKEIIVSLAFISILVYYLKDLLIKKSHRRISLSYALPLILFFISILLSLILNPEGRPEAIQSKGLILIILPLIALLSQPSVSSNNLNTLFVKITTVVTSLLSITSLLWLTLLHKSAYLPNYLQDITFTPTGNYLTTLTLLIIGLILSVYSLKHSNKKEVILHSTNILIHCVGIVAIFSLMLPGKPLSPSLLPLTASWSIALDSLKSLRTLAFGIGLSNYSLLYSAVKPLSLNLTSLWSTLPTTASNEFLTLLPTTGIIATILLLYMFIRSLIFGSTLVRLITSIIFISFLIAPATLPLYTLFFVVYTFTNKSDSNTFNLGLELRFLFGALYIASILIVLWIVGKSFLSEYYLKQAQLALAASNSQRVYDQHLKAIRTSSKITNYHLSFADVNFRLAAALSQKDQLSDADRDNITRLIQQSIASGKSAIALRPNDSRTWLIVGKIYQNLLNVAEGSDRFALEAYTKAVALDRANPTLRLEYANLLTQLAEIKGSTEAASLRGRAASEIQLAIQLKPDYANAYYNLGLILKKTNNPESAKRAFEEALKYLSPESSDAETIKLELNNSQNTSSITNSNSQVLTQPSPLPTPLEGGPLDIPTE